MFVRELGSGPAVMLLHGAPSSPDDFEPLVERLAKERRVLVPEMPGYLRTPMTPTVDAPYSIRQSVQLIDDMLAARGVTEVAVVGFSAGALRAFGLALDGRARVSALVSLGGLAGYTPQHRQDLLALAALSRTLPTLSIPAVEEMLATSMLSPSSVACAEHLAALRRWLACTTPEALAIEVTALAESEDLEARIGALRIPVLARVGALDRTSPPAYSQRIAAVVPGARCEIVEGKGHALLIEDREATVASVLDFLSAK